MSQHQLTKRIAYEIFVQRGWEGGRHAEDWRAAEAIVSMCLLFAVEMARAQDGEQPQASLHERALALLQAAVAESGRAPVATALGYKSVSSVGRYLRGDRPIGAKLAERIMETLAQSEAVFGQRCAA
jgi:hypothetical protein